MDDETVEEASTREQAEQAGRLGVAEPPAATVDGPTVTLRVTTHLVGSFDASDGSPVITTAGTSVAATEAATLIAKAAAHGVKVERVS